jgi:hypothetical protein
VHEVVVFIAFHAQNRVIKRLVFNGLIRWHRPVALRASGLVRFLLRIEPSIPPLSPENQPDG